MEFDRCRSIRLAWKFCRGVSCYPEGRYQKRSTAGRGLFALQLISWNGKFKEFVCEEFPDSSFDEALPGFDTPFRELEIDLEEIPCAGDEGVSRAEQSGETPPSPGVSGLAGVSPGA